MEPGFEIAGKFYPMPDRYRLCDPILVREVTGLDWAEFVDLLEDQDPACLSGLVSVAVWQQHPKWKRDRVVAFVENISMDALSVVGDEAEDDAADPTEGGTESSDGTSRPTSDDLTVSDAGTLATSGAL